MKKTAQTDMRLSSWYHYPIVVLLAVVLNGCGKSVGQVSVFDAAEKGDLDTVKARVQADPNVLVETDDFGRTLLDDAAMYGQPKVASFLLDHGADANGEDAIHQRPLHAAAGRRQLEVAKLLLQHGADVNAKTADGSTSLMYALGPDSDKASYDVVQLLLAHGADVNTADMTGRTALGLAAAEDFKNDVALLLAHKASINAKNSRGWTPLHYAAASGATEVVEPLLANGADIDALDSSGMTPLDIAAFQSTAEEKPSVGAFEIAQARGRKMVVQLLLSRQARYTIFDAAAMDDIEKIKAIVKDNPALISSKDGDGRTPLHYAASLGAKDVAEFLLVAKVDVNARDNHGKTPLACAVEAGRKDLTELLLTEGADVNVADDAGRTPLHWAAGIGFKDVQLVALLLDHGANVNAKAKDGSTPLVHATQNGDIAKYLVTHGGHL